MPKPSPNRNVPVSWPELITAKRQIYNQGAEWAEEMAEEIESLGPPLYGATGFAGPAVVVAARASIDGPATCVPLLDRLVPLIPRVLADFPDGSVDDLELPALYLLSFLNAARCCRRSSSESQLDLEPRWLPQLAERVG